MAQQVEEAMKAEQRTRSELIREALRTYFGTRFPVVQPSRAELAAIRQGRAEIKRGQYVNLDQLLNDLATANRKTSAKRARKNPR